MSTEVLSNDSPDVEDTSEVNEEMTWDLCFLFLDYPLWLVLYEILCCTTVTVWGTTVTQWLRRCATNRKVTGSIPAGVSGFFIDIKSFQLHYGHGVDSACNRNEYQEYFLGVKAAGA